MELSWDHSINMFELGYFVKHKDQLMDKLIDLEELLLEDNHLEDIHLEGIHLEGSCLLDIHLEDNRPMGKLEEQHNLVIDYMEGVDHQDQFKLGMVRDMLSCNEGHDDGHVSDVSDVMSVMSVNGNSCSKVRDDPIHGELF